MSAGRARAAALVAALAAAACQYTGLAPNGVQRCAPAGAKRCADGYHCAADDHCWLDGTNPAQPPPPDAGDSDVGIDAAGGSTEDASDAGQDRAATDVAQDTGGPESNDTPADSGPDATDAAVDAGVDTVIFTGPGCAPTLPAAGTICSPSNIVCTYGDAPRPECRDKATCTSGSWTIQRTTCPGLSIACPTTIPGPGDTVYCPGSQVGTFCRYPSTNGAGIECRCVGNPDTMGNIICAYPTPPGGSCPPMLPNAGTSCASTMTCAYPCAGPLYMSSVSATCGASGTWAWTLRSCNAN